MSTEGERGGDVVADGLYHLITPAGWEAVRAGEVIEPESLRTEGFVHCSWGHQVSGTVRKHFADAASVLALRLEPGRLGGVELIEEDSYGSGQAFPHLYGPVPIDAVAEVVEIATIDEIAVVVAAAENIEADAAAPRPD